MKIDMKELKNITLLYVEDDNAIREQTKTIFEKLFKKIFSASDGKEGLETYSKFQDEIDIVITDVNMPRMNGLEMIEAINELNNSLPIIVTTAHTDSEFLIKAINLNVDKYVTKPIQIKNLTLEIVDNVLKYRRANNIENLAKNLVTKTANDSNINNNLSIQVNQLKKQNEYYKAIIDNLVITCTIDKNGTIIEQSDKFLRLFDFTKEDIKGKNINIIQSESCSQESFQKLMLRVIHGKKTIVSSYIVRTHENKSAQADVTFTPTYDNNSLIAGYTVYIDLD